MLFSKKEKTLLAVADGRAVPLSDVPDDAFASGILGVGVGIIPSAGTISAPVGGRIETVSETRHAYTILSEDGLDILVHIGIDTVTLGGEGFLPMVKPGDRVRAGDVIARVDLELLQKRGLPTIIPVLITNPERITSPAYLYGDTVGGRTVTVRYRVG